MRARLLTLALISATVGGCRHANPQEGDITAHLAEAHLDIRPLYDDGRFPNVVVSRKGTVIATWGSRHVRARRSEDGGITWGPEITIANPGFHGGGTTIDERTGDILAFVEAGHPPADLTVHRSRDDGRTWEITPSVIRPDAAGHVPSMHMNEHGITLRRGPHAGRLIRPARWYAGRNHASRWPEHYTNAIYSDDAGATWNTSAPFGALGTGEAALAELSDGRIYYNSRRHWAPEGEDPRRRWTAWSADGGATWQGLAMCAALPDGPRDTDYGCMAGLARLPIRGRDILVYTNCDSPAGRRHGTAWVSFDGGATWPLKRLIHAGAFAYSSVAAGRPGTPSEGWIFVHFEGAGSKVARFNLAWLRGGVATGEGAIPPQPRTR